MKVKILLGLVVMLIVLLVAVTVGADDSFPVEIRRVTFDGYNTVIRVDDVERGQTCYIYHSFKFGGISCGPTPSGGSFVVPMQ